MKNRTKNIIENKYFPWLSDLIGVNRPEGSYFLLAKVLYEKGFTWFVPNDDNRAFEGRNLREQFCDEMHIDYVYEYFEEKVSMLELIIGLADRCESIMADQDSNVPMEDWFWKMLTNAGLDIFKDEDFYDLGGTPAVDIILNKIIDRTYHRDGRGGLFPLKHTRMDQRKVELWYQMSAYLVENYYTEDLVV
jgi:hypothetical protein